MKAVYITYRIGSGEILSVQTQYKGIAWKVADFPRRSGESVVRYSFSEEEHLDTGRLLGGVINGDRNLVIDGQVVVEEDRENSVVEAERVDKL